MENRKIPFGGNAAVHFILLSNRVVLKTHCIWFILNTQ